MAATDHAPHRRPRMSSREPIVPGLCSYCDCEIGLGTAESPFRCVGCIHLANLAAKYGLVLRDYIYLYEELFGGRCGICDEDLNPGGLPPRLCLDHWHRDNPDPRHLAASEGRIRGILCTTCNAGVKWVRPETAAHYTRKYEREWVRKVRTLHSHSQTSNHSQAFSPQLLIWGASQGQFQAPERTSEQDTHWRDEPTIVRTTPIVLF